VRKKLLFIQLFIYISVVALWAGGISKQQLVSDGVAIFYPENYNAKMQQPSFALVSEPTEKGTVPANWNLKPQFYKADGKQIAAFSISKGCSLYGTGEVKGDLLRNGTKIKLWNTDNFEYSLFDGKRLYQSHPWVLGVNADGTAFGIIADNTWRQDLELTDSIRFISDGPAFRVIVIKKNSPQEVIKELAQLTGKMQMPPLWALGYQQCRYSYIPDSRIKEIADTLRMKKLPSDVIWMDIDYMDHFKIFTFEKTKIPDPAQLNQYLHNKGFKSVWMIDPGVKAEQGYSVYDSGTQQNVWTQNKDGEVFHGTVWPGDCVFPDFTRPETRTWWSALYKNFMATGIDGVWNDMNEPSVFNGPDGTMPDDNIHRGGDNLPEDSHLRYHNVYGMLMVKASREGILKANPDKRPFILSRSGFLGSSRYAATWTGDNCSTTEHMKMSIPMTLNLGLSGQPFNGPDLGGFAMNATGDLFGQWIAMGVFFPFTRGHATNNVNNKEPWAFGSEIENVSRTALNRKYRLLPYYYTLFHESSVDGMPIMRPLFFADPKDSTLRKEDQAFLVGDQLMVIPRWAKNPSLPQGIWKNLVFENETTDSYQADVKIKGGAIIPMGKIIQNTTEYKTDSLTLQICLDENGKAQGDLYEDAGDGFEFQKGEYSITNFTAATKGNQIIVKIHQSQGKMKAQNHVYKIILLTNDQPIMTNWIAGKKIKINTAHR